jgi:hypothetical protein
MIDTIVSVLVVCLAIIYQILIGRKQEIGWLFGLLSYIVWIYAMIISHQWAYVGAGTGLSIISIYNWRAWHMARRKIEESHE